MQKLSHYVALILLLLLLQIVPYLQPFLRHTFWSFLSILFFFKPNMFKAFNCGSIVQVLHSKCKITTFFINSCTTKGSFEVFNWWRNHFDPWWVECQVPCISEFQSLQVNHSIDHFEELHFISDDQVFCFKGCDFLQLILSKIWLSQAKNSNIEVKWN